MTFFALVRAPASTPEGLIRDLAAAAKSGNTDAFLSGLTTESRKAVEKSLENKAALRAARREFDEALDGRFGKGALVPTSSPKDFTAVLKRISVFELISKKAGLNGTMDLRVKTTLNIDGFETRVSEHTFVARQENGVWKLDLNPNEHIDLEKEETALHRATEALRNGRFANRRSALLALNQIRLQQSVNPNIRESGASLGEKDTMRFKTMPIGHPLPKKSISVSSGRAVSPK